MSILTAWLVTALALAGLEMLTGTFYLLAIAIGMLFGALASWLGAPLALQFVVASLCALGAVAALRQWKRRQQPVGTDAGQSLDIGQRVSIETWLDATHARVRYRGSHWQAQLRAPLTAPLTEPLYIVAQQGNTLILDTVPPQS
ncbi:NfeD family protein [Chitiniphilus purpureus]|uniref:NfeD family protein n=1 Tax=Chitiniphilus purpureus TaxID=2981137 RepID=A0ABY6DR74_9NEIS|nr:NfeD family protein [Chitiniphilus sp. CD1]UXY14413.1 NfeD family protein [Chitiniphilus sp. CD1]